MSTWGLRGFGKVLVIKLPNNINKLCHTSLVLMMLGILVAWSPKSWSEYGWKNHLFVALFQASTSIFEWLLHMASFLVPLSLTKVV
jgi:hypothetical protein